MQQLHCLGCDWSDNDHMFLHQCANILINAIDNVTNVTHLGNVSNIFEMEVNEIIGAQSPLLVMLPTMHSTR